MTAARFRRAKEVFEQALELPERRRSAFIQTACFGDPDLEEEVRRLLVSDSGPAGILDEEVSWSGLIEPSPDPLTVPTGEPATIGPYRILDRLGVGGMGIVYRAREDSPPREVALKVLRSDATSSAALKRFEREVAILARLEHPGIARIYRAGATETDAGSCPYFAMELVEGHSLLEHARRSELSIQEKLQLLVEVIDTVQFAHERGIVHRDLKPENILVQASGRIKVLDFGIARTLDAEGTRHTATGQVIGTLAYMSPEQLFDGQSDERSDVYSLGVLFYELLAGRSPFDLRGGSLRQAMVWIQDVDPMPLGRIASELRGDLEVIALTALEKNPNRRYASARDFAADIRRFLREEPISARPATAFYHFRKFARRHRTLVTGALATATALLIGSVVSVLFAIQAGRDAREASESRVAMRQGLYRAQMIEASSVVRRPQGEGRVREIVEAWRPAPGEEDLRGWEWRLLDNWSRAEHDVLLPLEEVFDVDLHPNGHWLAAGGGGGVRVGDRLLEVWKPVALPAGGVHSVCWSPDGERLLVAGDPGLLMFRSDDLETPLWSRALVKPVGKLVWGPEPELIRMRGFGVGAALISAVDGSVVREMPRASRGRAEPCLSPDKSRLAESLDEQTIRVVSESGEVELPADSTDFGTLCWSPDSRLLAIGFWDGALVVWDVDQQKRLLLNRETDNRIDDLEWSPNGQWLATVSWDQTVRVWDPRQDLAVATLQGHLTRVTSLDWSDDGSILATGSALDAVRIWPASSWEGRSARFALGAQEATLDWRTDTETLRVAFDGGCEVYRSEADRLVSSEKLALVRGTWNAAGDRQLLQHEGRIGFGHFVAETLDSLDPLPEGFDLRQVVWHPRFEGLVAIRDPYQVKLSETGGSVGSWTTLPLPRQVLHDLAWDPQSSRIIIAGGKELIAYDVESGALEVIGSGRCFQVGWEPNGSRLAAAGSTGTTRIYRASDWQVTAVLKNSSRQITAVAWQPDTDRLVTADRQRTVNVWSADAGDLIASFELSGRALDLAWNESGETLAIASSDGILRLWSGRAPE